MKMSKIEKNSIYIATAILALVSLIYLLTDIKVLDMNLRSEDFYYKELIFGLPLRRLLWWLHLIFTAILFVFCIRILFLRLKSKQFKRNIILSAILIILIILSDTILPFQYTLGVIYIIIDALIIVFSLWFLSFINKIP